MNRPARFATMMMAAAPALGAAGTAPADTISLIGRGQIASTATDLSGIEDDRLIAFGSGIAYTGSGNRYVAVTDRASATATQDYFPRFQFFDVTFDVDNGLVVPVLVKTSLLVDEQGDRFTGRAGAFDPANPAASLRLDPEAIRVAPDGTIYIADELGPYIYRFDQDGRRIGVVDVPDKFRIDNPNANLALENTTNAKGRWSNRGMEGLAISPDGGTLFGLMQNPLLQDGALSGINNRILKVDLATGATSEFIYQLDDPDNNAGEILAINDHEFLVIERDKEAGLNSRVKKIYKIDLRGAIDVSAFGTTASDGLPLLGLPDGVAPVSKGLFLDLLDPRFGLLDATFPEKIEGIAFGPTLADGRISLLVVSDNDLPAPTNFYAFAIDPAALPGYVPQAFIPEPAAITSTLIGLSAVGLVALGRRLRRPRRAAEG